MPVEWIRSDVSTWVRRTTAPNPTRACFRYRWRRSKVCLSPPQSADEIGRIADFRVLRVLGIGGMAVVFEAEDSRLAAWWLSS